MAKRHLQEFSKHLSDTLYNKFEEINLEIGSALRTTMIDPGLVGELKYRAASIQEHLYSTSALLAKAAEDSKGFEDMGRHQEAMIAKLKETKAMVEKQEPDSPLLQQYQNMIESQQKPLADYYSVNSLRVIPNSKKKVKAYKGLVYTYKDFPPFVELGKKLDQLNVVYETIMGDTDE